MKNVKTELNIIIVMACIITTVAIKSLRSQYHEVTEVLSLVLDVAPSFFYVFGGISLIPILNRDLSLRKFIEYSSFFTIGACIYELSQIWTSARFDIFDLLATFAAYILALHLNLNRELHYLKVAPP